jgi:dethiobiotin synthetase
MSTRPRGLVVVTGTGTGVGKTWFSAVTLGLLRDRGVTVAARKPVQSFSEGEHPTDAEVLAAATGEDANAVCPPHRHFERAMAPPMAAEALGRPAFTIADLAREVTWPDGMGIGLVEGAGGPHSPLATDGDTVDLVAALDPDLVVVVADPELGAINAVRLTVAPFAPRPVVVAFNRFDEADELHDRNRTWLELRARLDVVTSPTALADRLTHGPGGGG